MKRTRFTDEQIISILAEHEAGANCAEQMLDLAAMKELVSKKW